MQLETQLYLVVTRFIFHFLAASTQVSADHDNLHSSIQELTLSRTSLLNNTENECVENRLEALELGRRCSRRCRKDMPCENTRKQCLCDNLCGFSCVKPDSTCHTLPKIDNGDYNPKHNKFGATVTFKCLEGHYLFGPRNRICQGDGEWSGTPTKCLKEPLCHKPIQINHARNPSDDVYHLGDKVFYSCNAGYQSQGSPEAVCKLVASNHTAWVWTESRFKCIPKSCGDPGQIEHGKRHGESFIIASTVYYTCDEGYEMVGQSRRYCQSDNQWSGQQPQCEPIASCKSAPVNPKNGRVRVVSMDHGSKGFVHCLDGYRLKGDHVTQCNKGRWQQIQSACIEIYCGFPGVIEHGRVILVGLTGMYDYKPYIRRISNNRQIIYECENGYRLNDGAPSGATCINGHWRPEGLPTCLKE